MIKNREIQEEELLDRDIKGKRKTHCERTKRGRKDRTENKREQKVMK